MAELRYKAWGEPRFSYGTTPTKRQYTGQISEMATIGLYFYGARFYDPVLSRFTSADSIIPGAGDVQAWDRYAFVNNNPLRYTDPTGHAQACADGDEGGGVGQALMKNKSSRLLTKNMVECMKAPLLSIMPSFM